MKWTSTVVADVVILSNKEIEKPISKLLISVVVVAKLEWTFVGTPSSNLRLYQMTNVRNSKHAAEDSRGKEGEGRKQ